MLSRDVAIVNGMVRTKDRKTKDDVDKILYSRQGFVIKKDKDGDILVFIPNKPAGIYFKTFEGALKFVNSFVKDREYLSGHGTGIFQRLAEKELKKSWNNEDSKTKDEDLKEKLIRLAEQAGDKEYADDIRNGYTDSQLRRNNATYSWWLFRTNERYSW